MITSLLITAALATPQDKVYTRPYPNSPSITLPKGTETKMLDERIGSYRKMAVYVWVKDESKKQKGYVAIIPAGKPYRLDAETRRLYEQRVEEAKSKGVYVDPFEEFVVDHPEIIMVPINVVNTTDKTVTGLTTDIVITNLLTGETSTRHFKLADKVVPGGMLKQLWFAYSPTMIESLARTPEELKELVRSYEMLDYLLRSDVVKIEYKIKKVVYSDGTVETYSNIGETGDQKGA